MNSEQRTSSSNLSLQITPMQMPEVAMPNGLTGSERKAPLLGGMGAMATVAASTLLLYPGETSEMVVQIKNLGTRMLELQVESKGNFPSTWCRLHVEEDTLAPDQEIYAVLYFRVPANFFEEHQTLGSSQSLVLDYRSRIEVNYTQLGTGQQGVESRSFNLYVRPRSLYLNFLPALYREDFVGRFLKIFEQAFEPAVGVLDTLWAYLDPLTAPEALLSFLAYWVALPLDSRWSVSRQRHLIRQAVDLYRWRGTRRGLRLYLHLYTDLPLDDHLPQEADKHICIEEIFSAGFILGRTRLGQDSLLGSARPYHFIVRLRLAPGHQIDKSLVQEVIEREKPAFCTYDLFITESN